MIRKLVAQTRALLNKVLGRSSNVASTKKPSAVYRNLVNCTPELSDRFVLKIADTKEELEACFTLLHDAYVSNGFMKPHPSGMRVTIYHALPTTTTLCAKFDGQVVGTLSLIRESVMGFPLQRIFDLTAVREKKGNIVEASALAVHRKFRRIGGSVLFPLLKFMHNYCTTFFDTRHVVIAVNPKHSDMYESLLFFQRLTQNVVENYDFVNGAPAVGAALDLRAFEQLAKKHYGSEIPKRNLHAFFFELKLPNIQLPARRFYTTNDPVLTPELLDYFFNVRTNVFRELSDRKKRLLHEIYDLADYRAVLPTLPEGPQDARGTHHRRFSVRCPATFLAPTPDGKGNPFDLEIFQLSRYGFQANARAKIPINVWGDVTIQLGPQELSRVKVSASRGSQSGVYLFRLGEPDLIWRKFVNALYAGSTQADLENATRFMTDR